MYKRQGHCDSSRTEKLTVIWALQEGGAERYDVPNVALSICRPVDRSTDRHSSIDVYKRQFHDRSEILDLLDRKAPGSVSTLRGRHPEAFVIVNLVEGTTMSSNRFAADHAGSQAFGYDLWRSRQLVQALFPLPSHQIDRERFIHARVMITIATLMALTDGSLQVLMRLP